MSDEKLLKLESNLEKATEKMNEVAIAITKLTGTVEVLIEQQKKDEAWRVKTEDRITKLETLEAVRNDRDQTVIWIKRAVVTAIVGAFMALILYKVK